MSAELALPARVRVQLSLEGAEDSVPEPDLALASEPESPRAKPTDR